MTTRDLAGVHVEPDGTITDVIIAAGTNLPDYFRKQFNAGPEYGHYGTVQAAVTVVVHEFSQLNGMPVNEPVTRFIGDLRGAPLYGYALCGPIYVFGFQPGAGDMVDLPEELRHHLAVLGERTEGGVVRG